MSGIQFFSPSQRAAGNDLAISINPLGLVELSDEEFEVSGPRLSRYATYWAFYLGQHFAYRRPPGEPQFCVNWSRALADFISNFCFSRGAQFRSIPEYSHIIPALLKKVWEVWNVKDALLWEIAQSGGICGDAFVKVAWEPPYADPNGMQHEGQVKVIPLHPATCFPEFAPHDKNRLLRFKLKYRFYGCVDMETEALTKEGWKRPTDLKDGDEILTLNPDTDEIQWKPATVNVYDYTGELVRWDSRVDALTTPNHRWLAETPVVQNRKVVSYGNRQVVRTLFPMEGDASLSDLPKYSHLILGGGTPLAFSEVPKWSDEVVETVAWFVTEGGYHVNQNNFLSAHLSQSELKNPDNVARIRGLSSWWKDNGGTFTECKKKSDGMVEFYLGKGVMDILQEICPEKEISPDFICSLTYHQAQMFYETLIDGDGCRTHGTKKTVRWGQLDRGRKDGFQMLASMLGHRTNARDDYDLQVYKNRHIMRETALRSAQRVWVSNSQVWCPTVEGGVWFARRNNSTYWTGNTSPAGTRQVFTYMELMTNEVIEEYINDELVDQRPNPLGVIPVVHIPNIRVSGSPWGLSDIHDIVPLNMEYNEKCLELSDIINYYAAPVTVLTGAKMSNLERGANKVWAIPNENARVENLEGGVSSLGPTLQYLEMLKSSMFEMVGVPINALGQEQAISNTSGVALDIQYLPMMQRLHMKHATYGVGLQEVNALILRTLYLFVPESILYDPTTEGIQTDPDQPNALDPRDPLAYRTFVHWPEPLPTDKLVKLNEVQAMMALNMESRRGALRDLGEEFPDEKMEEILDEMKTDAIEQGALDMFRARINSVIVNSTGILPQGDGSSEAVGPPAVPPDAPSQGGSGSGEKPVGALPGTTPQSLQKPPLSSDDENLLTQLVTLASGTKLAQTRNPNNN